MALRSIVQIGQNDEVLRKKAREVTQINDRVLTLLDDMAETLRAVNGIGLAAPQVGVLRRIVVVDVSGSGEGGSENILELINPVIAYEKGEQTEFESCLSVPERSEKHKRPMKVVVRAQNRNGETFETEGEGLLARQFCHEIDHLNGVLYIDDYIPTPEEDE
jgi:peptide deformylase